MSPVAIFTDSASDMDPAVAAAEGITIVPLLVTFGSQSFKAGVDLSTAQFWDRMVAPDAPFPKTAASSPGEFKEAYEAAFEAGAGAIVSVNVASELSGTIKSAQIAADMLPDREIHVVDSRGASMAEGILARLGVELAADGRAAEDIAATLEARGPDMRIYVALETRPAELGGDVLGGEVEAPRRGPPALEQVGGQEGDMPAERVRRDPVEDRSLLVREGRGLRHERLLDAPRHAGRRDGREKGETRKPPSVDNRLHLWE